MSWRVVEPKITVAVTVISSTPTAFYNRNSSSLQHKTPQKSRYPLPLFRYYQNAPNKYQYTSSPNKPLSNNSNLQVFDTMSQRGQNLENTWFYNVLDLVKFSSMKPDKKTVKIVHCLVLKVGFFARLPTSTSLLITYSRAGECGSSMKLFDDIEYKDAIVWNAMMTICIENKNFGFVLDLFDEMRERGEGFDSGTLVIAMSAITNTKNLKKGRVFHGFSVKQGMLSDSYLCNSIIDMYAKCGDLGSSVSMFDSMEVKDHVSWNSIISGCLYNKSPQKSLQYFKKMANIGIRDNVSFSCAIAASTYLRDLDSGETIHGQGIKLGYAESIFISVENALISFYFECGHSEAAKIVFRGMFCEDVVTWNSMINGFALNKMAFEAFDLLYEMQMKMLVQPDSVTVVTIVPLCAESGLSREGKSVHAYVIRRDMGTNVSVINSLMNFYIKCSNIKAAEYLFNAMCDRDLISWNTVVSGYSQLGYCKQAKSLFKEVIFWYSECSLSTILAIIPSCCSLESFDFGKTIHSWQLKQGFLSNILAINALMFMYINCGDLKAASSLLASVYDVADTASWNTLITGCSQNGFYWKALETFNLMRTYNVNCDRITLSNVISICGNLGLVNEGKLLHGLCLKFIEGTDIRVHNALSTMYGELGDPESANLVFTFSQNRNLCSWNCIISAFTRNKDGRKALEMFRSLDIEPNEITISSVLSACTRLGVLSHGRQIHAYIFRSNFETNTYICAALVDMYSNCGKLDKSVQVFRSLPNKSVAAWNSMISAYGYHNSSEKTIKTFNEMIQHGISPSKSTFINLLSACSHLGLVDEGQYFYHNMLVKFGIEPEIEHQVCMVDILGRSGKLREARGFIEKLPNRPQPSVWGALLSACGYYGDLEMGKEIAEILFRLEPDNAGYYVSLFNMYVGAGRWDDAAKLRRNIEEKGLIKLTGASLIDVHFG